MDDFDIIRYEFEIVLQARIGVLAARRLLALHANPLRELQEADSEKLQEVNDGVHLYRSAFLNAAANVSKLLWPPKTSSLSQRGPILRAIFAIPEDSPLMNRKVRNWLEHKDMELEKSIVRGPPEGRPPGWDTSVGIAVSGPVGSPHRFAFYIGFQKFEGNPIQEALSDIVERYKGPVGNRIYDHRPDLRPAEQPNG